MLKGPHRILVVPLFQVHVPKDILRMSATTFDVRVCGVHTWM